MSLRVKKPFGLRSDNTQKEPNKKFIFAFEGEETEKQYFEGINNNRIELGIKDIISIEQLERNDPSQSNQLKVVQEVRSYFKNIISCQDCCDDIKKHLQAIINDYSDYLGEKYQEIISLVEDVFKDDNYKDNINEFIEKLNLIMEHETLFSDLMENIKNFNIGLEYDKDFDTVCIIIDRDRGSFTKIQYDEVINICDDNNYRLGITNPCFEFWLLLHLTDATEYSKEDIFENGKKSKNGKRFLERCLIDKLGAYNKKKIRFDNFKAYIDKAIENEKLYCNDIVDLKENIGSSIGVIISEFIQ